MTPERSEAVKQRRKGHKKARVLLAFVVVLVIASAAAVLILSHDTSAPKVTAKTAAIPTKVTPSPVITTPVATQSFNKAQYSTTDSASLWVVVNKQHPLTPIDYAPSDLVTAYGHQVSSRMVTDLTDMITDASKIGDHITIASSYRSYAYQVGLYNQYVAADGQAKADTYSARPGYSEHQTGLAIDFGDAAGTCIVQTCYASTPEGQWLAANAYKYGFLLRYTAAEQSVTGYEAEPWHYRYIGRDLALEMHSEGILTLEDFFGITGGETYN